MSVKSTSNVYDYTVLVSRCTINCIRCRTYAARASVSAKRLLSVVNFSLAAVRLLGGGARRLPFPAARRGSCAPTRAARFCDARFRGCSYPAAPYPAFVSVSLAAVRLWGRAVLAFACMFVPYVLRVAAGRLSRAFGRASVSACRSVWCVAVRPLCSGATRVLHASLMSTII